MMRSLNQFSIDHPVLYGAGLWAYDIALGCAVVGTIGFALLTFQMGRFQGIF